MDAVWHCSGLGVSFTSWIVSPFCDCQEVPIRNGDGVIRDVPFRVNRSSARGETDALDTGASSLEKQLALRLEISLKSGLLIDINCLCPTEDCPLG